MRSFNFTRAVMETHSFRKNDRFLKKEVPTLSELGDLSFLARESAGRWGCRRLDGITGADPSQYRADTDPVRRNRRPQAREGTL